MFIALPIVTPIAAVAAITKFHLMGKSLKRYDDPALLMDHEHFSPDPDSDGIAAVKEYLIENFIKPAQTAERADEQLSAKRERFEQAGLRREFDVAYTPAIASFGGTSVDGEWVTAKGTNPDTRILYIHGGAFTVGSAISHRAITSNLALKTGCAVFAPNYRLMPENERMASIEDVQAAYRWILNNGPDGPAEVKALAVAGDSAGGNLTLMLSNWVRDRGLRAADAVAAISPATDSTAESPSIKANYETDLMLKPLVGPLLKIPRSVLVWFSWRANKISPASPLVSPVRDELSNLPPTLVHVSTAEMLLDDAKRYAAKAQSQGSPVKLQTWDHMAHVWHAFDSMLPESHDALDEIAKFFAQNGVSGN